MKSYKGELIPQDYAEVKRLGLIVTLVGMVIGMCFALAKLSFGDFTSVVVGLLTALATTVTVLIQKYLGTTEYPTGKSK